MLFVIYTVSEITQDIFYQREMSF